MLESYIKSRRKEKEILLMTHIVLGYPDFDASYKIIEAMINAGVDLMELQIPFSEPIADGPVILHANQRALANGVTVAQCLDFCATIARTFPIPFLFMTYYNIVFKYGTTRFVKRMAELNLQGAIIPDLPPEEGGEYLEGLYADDLSPIFIFSPTTPPHRMTYIASKGRGFIYCVARKGVTGSATQFSTQLDDYLTRCRQATQLPLALGFGVKEKKDIDFLTGKVDIAVIGSQTIRLVDQYGTEAVEEFIQSLR